MHETVESITTAILTLTLGGFSSLESFFLSSLGLAVDALDEDGFAGLSLDFDAFAADPWGVLEVVDADDDGRVLLEELGVDVVASLRLRKRDMGISSRLVPSFRVSSSTGKRYLKRDVRVSKLSAKGGMC